ncbi:DUF2851 family protein [Lentisphaera profundi]|uniref:DUF2851 family protein n=1 Tax=Lentisphaera profundi TaxID=1658616 RepID=A0ABY7VS86_9BACT|nr:DUF2851 family protein [Lentisphaera profundi]WDE97065.1 DUF2851 family protein [Lentisphaera profundi]
MQVNETEIKEVYLQALWNEQDFCRKLISQQAEKIEVIYPGKWNTGAGPDFLNAHLIIDGKEISGDVEIHFSPQDWLCHGHQNDPRYDNVILHAVWQNSAKDDPSGKSLLLMDEICSMSLCDLEERYQNYSQQAKHKPVEGVIEFSSLSDEQMKSFLEKMAFLRLAQKASHLEEQIKVYGVEQAIYQDLMEAFGYTQNRQAFLILAKSISLKRLQECDDPEAILWGESSLLKDSSQSEVHEDLKAWHQKKWNAWAKFRSTYQAEINWSRRVRPQNTPERRLAGATLFLKNINWNLEIFLNDLAENITSLESYYQGDDLMESFTCFSKKLSKAISLVGESRQREIRLNVFYPYLFLSLKGENELELVKKSYLAEKKGDETGLLREASCRFFLPPSRMKNVVKKFVHQQGLYFLLKNPEWLKECRDYTTS